MIETQLIINTSRVVVDDKTAERFNELRDSLPKEESSAKIFIGPNESRIKLYHNQETNRIVVLYELSTIKEDTKDSVKIAGIDNTVFGGNNILEFYFNFGISISFKEDGYCYDDYTGFFNLMNNLLEDNIFKIKEV